MTINPHPARESFYCNRKHKIAYLRVNKCACSSLAYFVASLKTAGVLTPLWKKEHLQNNFDLVTPDETALSDYLTFTFVRNPYDRFISFYSNWIVSPPHERVLGHYQKYGIYENMPFEECVKAFVGIKDHHLLEAHGAPLYTFVFRENTLRVKFVGKLEDLDGDMEFVARACSARLTVPHRNKTERTVSHTARTKPLIYEYYKKDFELFGYER